ncbi:bifunctional methylenetetrahydrofolate dehydrogenase/cyclohydrolase, mitochondrial isoform X2 [Elephas maximus indicus]|uniref:bifunctional methylenetetrahydrofolate dehydrogenase/cyclohydrolase, mitochondrial isoform X2 n=1 Tax=Elephas maximus indicus TaxID=99487 RepID=UPI002116B4A5|nr:bifunctional methylenetetrahydrofolate dehydrogenase/cyclohydrolase, mitochondrial isoform X2 [Elephas maximus indicus]
MAVLSLVATFAARLLRPAQSCRPHCRSLHLSAVRGEAIVISGKKLAQEIKQEVRQEVEQWVASGNKRPYLSVVLVGENPASHSYVLNKTKAAADVGITSETILKPASISEEELLNLISKLNNNDKVDGLLVQLPLPEHIDERKVCNAVSPEKDVDGFHVINVGRMCLDQYSMLPATPWGVWEIIKRTGIPNLITADMIKEGAAVIDVGINRVQDPITAKPKLVGDVDFEGVRKKAGYITPVPGGVGPMTVAMLMKNTVIAAKKLLRLEERDVPKSKELGVASN